MLDLVFNLKLVCKPEDTTVALTVYKKMFGFGKRSLYKLSITALAIRLLLYCACARKRVIKGICIVQFCSANI